MDTSRNGSAPADEPDEEEDPSPLHTAVKLGDFIRKNVQEQQRLRPQEAPTNDRQPSKGFVEGLIDPSTTGATPGLLEGLAAALATAALLTPLRTGVMRATPPHMGPFADLLTTTSLAVGASLSGLYVGSLTGSTEYLRQLAAVPTRGDSRTADAICRSPLVRDLLQRHDSGGETPPQYVLGQRDPRQKALQAYQDALQRCRDRAAYQQDSQFAYSELTWHPES